MEIKVHKEDLCTKKTMKIQVCCRVLNSITVSQKCKHRLCVETAISASKGERKICRLLSCCIIFFIRNDGGKDNGGTKGTAGQ